MTKNGRYRIQTVVSMTGVSAATLRAWERRYGLPRPARSGAAYRLYSDRDVESILQLRDLCARGMAPSEAARLINEGAVPKAVLAASTPEPVAGGPYVQLVAASLRAITACDSRELEQVLQRARLGMTAVELLDQLVAPVMHEVGERWHRGKLSVAAEHLASEQLGTLARELLRLLRPAEDRGSVVLACLAWETHTLALYLVGARLAQWGLQPLLLGGRLPAEELARVVEQRAPVLVALSVSLPPPHGVDAVRALEAYAEACGGTPWIIGGAQAERWTTDIERLGGHLAPPTLGELKPLVERLLEVS